MTTPELERILKAIPPVLLDVKSWERDGTMYVVIPIKVWGALEAAYEDVFGQVLPEEIKSGRLTGRNPK